MVGAVLSGQRLYVSYLEMSSFMLFCLLSFLAVWRSAPGAVWAACLLGRSLACRAFQSRAQPVRAALHRVQLPPDAHPTERPVEPARCLRVPQEVQRRRATIHTRGEIQWRRDAEQAG